MKFDINKHKFFLLQILKDIYSDHELSVALGFKGGTAQMLFYDLPRFSVDLDFNLINKEKKEFVYDEIRQLLQKYGSIRDEAMKHYGLILVLDYGTNERNLKIEISGREFPDTYEIKNFLGINMKVLTKPDLFTHKICALTDRSQLAGRDIFDLFFFLKDKTPLNLSLFEFRMKTQLPIYIDKCIKVIEKTPESTILNSVGQMIDEQMKLFVKKNLKTEILQLLRIFKEYPLYK